MSVSPEDPHGAFLLSMLARAEAGSGVVRETRDYLTRDSHPSAGTASPVEEGAALVRNWSAATVEGDIERAAHLASAIEQEAGASPFPFRATLAEYHRFDFAIAMAAGPGSTTGRMAATYGLA